MADIHYATSDGLQLAYQVVGDGPHDLLLVTEWATPLEARWQIPAISHRLERLASFSRVISFDKRGIGLSDPAAIDDVSTPELWVRDLVAVLDAVGSDRAIIFGAHEGGQIAMLFAASAPDRTEALILANTGARLTRVPDHPIGFTAEQWRPDLPGVLDLWSSGSGGEPHIAATGTDPWWRDWYARSRRQQASPTTGLGLLHMMGELDVRQVLPIINVPTLVLHREGNTWWPVAQGRYLSEHIPNAEFKMLGGADNYWWAGDADSLIDAVEQFIVGERLTEASDRVLATLLFTDIVSSTEQLAQVGDQQWTAVLDEHDSITSDVVRRLGGRLIKRLGDGMLATFDGPARAIDAARAIRDNIQSLGVHVRLAVHTGEVEQRNDDVGGVAVHLTARILDQAGADEIWVSGVVKGLVAGSGISFTPRGTQKLRGIPDEWDLFTVD